MQFLGTCDQHIQMFLLADAFLCGGLATARCSRHASKQAGKALRSQGHPHRIKRSRILATLQQNKGM